MSWCLRVVERVDGGERRTVDVIDIGAITAPTELAMLGLTTVSAKTVLAALQSEFVALQETALTEAARRSPRPIKDHRRRVLQTPFGTVALRVPRLRGRADALRRQGVGRIGHPDLRLVPHLHAHPTHRDLDTGYR